MIYICAAAAGTAMALFSAGVYIMNAKRKKVLVAVGGENGFFNGAKAFVVYAGNRAAVINKPILRFKRYKKISKMLAAGESGMNIEKFILIEQIFAVLIFVFIGGLTGVFLLAVTAAVAVFLMPGIILTKKYKKSRSAIEQALPDALDIIRALVEGGMSLDAAIEKYAGDNTDELAVSMKKALKKSGLGVPLHTTLYEEASRCGVKDMRDFALTVKRAEESGESIRGALQSNSENAREKYIAAMKKKAHEAPVKLMIPLVLFIFPVVFIILLGPVFIRLSAGF